MRVIGATDHYARAELVTLAADDAAPVFVDRRRVELIDKGLPTAPYHREALKLDIKAAIELVNRVRHSVAEHVTAAASTMLKTLRAHVLILPSSPYHRLPDSLEEVLRSRPLTYAAAGMLYREFLAEAATELGLEVRRYPRKTDPMMLAAKAMGVDLAAVTSVIAQFGREGGRAMAQGPQDGGGGALGTLAPDSS